MDGTKDEVLKFEDLDTPEFEDMFDAYNSIEDLASNPVTVFFEAEYEEDVEDYGHYLTAIDEENEGLGDFLSRYSSDLWEIEVPQDIIDRVQEQYLNGKTGEKFIDIKEYVWYEQWPNIRPEEIDPLQSAADFYLLFGITSDAFVKYDPVKIPTFLEIQSAGRKLKKSYKEIEERQKLLQKKAEEDPRAFLSNLKTQADKRFHDLVEELDKSFREYVHLACGGELRHHEKISPILSGYRRGSWVHWKFVFEKYGVEAIDQMAEMFLEFPDTAYGGPAWHDAAVILAQRERGELGPDSFINKQLFVDRVFTLEHNGGCFLNKLEWVNKREKLKEPYSYHFECMVDTVLKLHSEDELNIDEMIKYASEEVQDLVRRYLDLAVEHNYSVNGKWKEDKPIKPIKLKKPESQVVPMIDWSDELHPIKIDQQIAELMKQNMIDSFKESKSSLSYESGMLSKSLGIPPYKLEGFGAG